MPRPHKLRKVSCNLVAWLYRPVGKPVKDLETVNLYLDELEALRLADGEGLDQINAGEEMEVSRATVGRILEIARRKVALALVEGKAIAIVEEGAPIKR